MARVRKLALAALLGLFAAGGLAGCGWFGPNGDPVVLVGDSILAMSSVPTERLLKDEGWSPTIDARPGASIHGFPDFAWSARVAELVQAKQPEFVVVELGSNDCGCDVAAAIDTLMEPLRDVDHVIWLNVRDPAPVPRDPAATNAALDAATDRYDNLEIVDMNAMFDEHPDWILPDDIHPNTAGQEGVARLIRDALDDAAGPLGP